MREFAEVPPRLRVMIEDAIESLLLLLDEIDGAADMEDGDIDYIDERETEGLWQHP